MKAIMAALRQTPPAEIAGTPVACQKDYQDGTARDTATGTVTQMELVGSNVLAYDLADGTTIVVRPSGTEPKIKVYLLTKGDSMPTARARWTGTGPGRGPGPVTGGARGGFPRKEYARTPLDPMDPGAFFGKDAGEGRGKRKEPWRNPTKRRRPVWATCRFYREAAGYLTKILKNGIVYPT